MPALTIGIDPAANKLALVALSPLYGTARSKKYVMGPRYEPKHTELAYDVTIEFLQDVVTMRTSTCGFVAWVEQPLVGRGGIASSLKQAFVSGAVQAALIACGYEVHLVNQSTWKSWLGANPRAGKESVAACMKRRFPKDWHRAGGDVDLADAFAIARYGEAIAKRSDGVA